MVYFIFINNFLEQAWEKNNTYILKLLLYFNYYILSYILFNTV